MKQGLGGKLNLENDFLTMVTYMSFNKVQFQFPSFVVTGNRLS